MFFWIAIGGITAFTLGVMVLDEKRGGRNLTNVGEAVFGVVVVAGVYAALLGGIWLLGVR